MQEADHDVGVDGSMGGEDSDAKDIQEGSNRLALLIQTVLDESPRDYAVRNMELALKDFVSSQCQHLFDPPGTLWQTVRLE
eukprot:4659662-Pleurochrysis_carterae.AAC.1